MSANELVESIKIVEDSVDVLQFLQALDNDREVGNGIQITTEVVEALKEALSKYNLTATLPQDETTLEDVVNEVDEQLDSFSATIPTKTQVAEYIQSNQEDLFLFYK